MKPRMTITEKFTEFHKDNPHVYEQLKSFARELVAAGHKKLSISLIVERVRWETAIRTVAADPFKISNNHKPEYARLLDKEPEFAGKFALHARTAV